MSVSRTGCIQSYLDTTPVKPAQDLLDKTVSHFEIDFSAVMLSLTAFEVMARLQAEMSKHMRWPYSLPY